MLLPGFNRHLSGSHAPCDTKLHHLWLFILWEAGSSSDSVMPWPNLWSSSTKDDRKDEQSLASKAATVLNSSSESVGHASDSTQQNPPNASSSPILRTFTEPQTIVAAAVLTAASLGLYRFYRSYLRRIPQATGIAPGFLRKRSIVGKVTSVGDGDNFRIYHTPGGRLAGWGWFPGRRVPTDKKELKDQTVYSHQGFSRSLMLIRS